MLFVKDMLFLDGAMAVMAPNVDVIGRDRQRRHVLPRAPRRAHRPGDGRGAAAPSPPSTSAGIRASLGVDRARRHLTYRELQERRELIRRRLEQHQRGTGPAGAIAAYLGRRRPAGLPPSRCPEPPVPGLGGVGMGRQLPALALSVVSSITCLAVDVAPDTTAVTCTVSPVLTLPIPISPPLTLVPESTVKVPEVPSALFTVSDHVLPAVSVTSDTVPVRSDRVS